MHSSAPLNTFFFALTPRHRSRFPFTLSQSTAHSIPSSLDYLSEMRSSNVAEGRRRRHSRAFVVFFLAVFLCVLLFTASLGRSAGSSHGSLPTGMKEAVNHTAERAPILTSSADDEEEWEKNDGVCPGLSFQSFVASAMGFASSTRALSTCGTTPFSTIFDDIRLARRAREGTDTISAQLHRLTHGNTEELVFYDNALDFLSLQAEIGAWVRANRTVGMSPSAYEAVVRGAAAVLGLNTSLLNTRFVEIPEEDFAMPVNWTHRMQMCNWSSSCIQQIAQAAYRQHANASLRARPATLVSNATFTRAQQYYEHVVFPSVIVRTFDLDPTTTTYNFDRNLRGLLRAVQQTWDAAVREAEAEAQSNPNFIATPYLPYVRETDITGPPRRETWRLASSELAYSRPSRHSGLRLQPLRRIMPAIVLYQTNPDCTSCDILDHAFDILPAVYKRMCSHGYRSIVSCSPITLFLRTTHVRAFQLLPAVELYARLSYARGAVLRVADHNFRQEQQLDGGGEGEERQDGGSGSIRDFETTAEDDDGDDDSTRGSLFYSLQVKYSKLSSGFEDEVRPRSQFQPIRLPLRLQLDVATVEQAVVNIIADLVGSGVIQFLFLDPDEVTQITRENERVKRMLLEQRQRQEQQNDGNTTEKRADNQTASTAPLSGGTDASSTSSSPSSPPSTNLEDHPQYRKVVSFHDLATKLVAAHTRAVFGDVRLVRSPRRQHRFHRSSGSSSSSLGGDGGDDRENQPWWASLWMFRLLHAVWELLFSGVERPLFVTVFILLCLCQKWWNRWQHVSYW